MNKLTLSAIALFIGLNLFAQNDPVIMTINDKNITKSEFLQIYLKNNTDPKYDKESLDEYMELFKKFKLKVAEAEALGYDTIPKLMKELAGYRKQLALPYLVDSTKNEAMIKEAYERTKKEIRASHILIKVTPNASPEDTLRAYNILLGLKKRIEGGEDFAAVAKGRGGSEDPSAANNGGDLGFFTAFQMVYPFEEQAYNTKVGSVSQPFRTRFGYHILKVTDIRDARGTIETAHIMVAVDRNADDATQTTAEAKINEIYGLLEEGGIFEELVEKFSDDPSSNKKKGVLPAFGTGTTTRMVPEFEEAAFDLKNNGDYSKPIRTDYGFHIVKRINLTDVPSFELMKSSLESKIAKDDRSKATQDSFVAKLKKEYGYSDKSSKGLDWFIENLDSTYYRGQFDPSILPTDKTLFTLGKNAFTQKDFAAYLKSNYRGVRQTTNDEVVRAQYKLWEKQAILDYEESKLASKYPAFKALVTEYHDGILLYEIMSDLVWNKAMKDTTGLQNFYEQNKANYKWGERVDSDIYECYSKEFADKTYKLLQKNDAMKVEDVVKAINDDTELNIRSRSGKYDINTTSYLKDAQLKVGLNKPFEVEGKFYVIKVKEVLAPTSKEFSEAKGSITSDYQNELEKNWLADLEKRHKIVINKEELYSIGK